MSVQRSYTCDQQQNRLIGHAPTQTTSLKLTTIL